MTWHTAAPRVLVCAGEPSADRYAADLATALGANHPDIIVEGVGGSAMHAVGVHLLERIDRLSAMGLIEGVRTLPAHTRLLQRLAARFRRGAYDLVVLVDYPGFHLRVARAASRRGVPVLYYVAPQLWAWGGWRARTLKAHVRELAVVLPFEEPYFTERGIPSTFVGHPLLDAAPAPSPSESRRTLGVSDRTPVLALFPGSRPSEIQRMWPVFRAAALRVRNVVPELSVVVSAIAGYAYAGSDEFLVWRGDSSVALAAADAGLCKSGTTTLQAALAGMPMVIGYRMHPLTFTIAKRVVRVPHVGLVNLIANRRVVPEFLQRDARPEVLATAALPLLDPASSASRKQRDEFSTVRAALGEPGAARRVADMAARLAA